MNLAAGEGLVFNPGEAVEGYSNLLWTRLLSLFIIIGADPPGNRTREALEALGYLQDDEKKTTNRKDI